MDTDDVRERVAAIAKQADDPEAAHGAEDDLYVAVLEAVAKGAPNAAELAAEALKACALNFTRWYA